MTCSACSLSHKMVDRALKKIMRMIINCYALAHEKY